MFEQCDLDRSGTIDERELYQYLKGLGVELPVEAVQNMIATASNSSCADIDFNEWKWVLLTLSQDEEGGNAVILRLQVEKDREIVYSEDGEPLRNIVAQVMSSAFRVVSRKSKKEMQAKRISSNEGPQEST
mmetsp:Transcript_38747/g.60440  ORF Transcript_38747/g.60440 Transcript_38747/m.60440 type:complete len:131 (-) Transcript_38747:42-434(-)